MGLFARMESKGDYTQNGREKARRKKELPIGIIRPAPYP